MLVGGRPMGALTVYYEIADDITPLRLETAARLCRLAAAAIAQPSELQSIHALCREFSACTDRKEAAQRTTDCALRILGCNAVEFHCQVSSSTACTTGGRWGLHRDDGTIGDL